MSLFEKITKLFNFSPASISTKQVIFFYIIGITSIILLIFGRYSGNYHSNYKFIWLYLNGGLTNDIYINSSLAIQTSIFYPLLNFFKVNLDHDVIGIIFHYIFSIFGAIYLFKILKKYLGKNDNLDIFIIVISLSILDHIVLHTVRSGWINTHTMTSSQAALSFFFYYLWQVLNKNTFNLYFSSAILFLLSIKVAFFPIGCFFIFMFWYRKNFLDILWIIPCIVIALYFQFQYSVVQTESVREILFNEVLRREEEEVAIHLQETWRIMLVPIYFIIYAKLLKFINNPTFRQLSLIVLIISILLFIIGGLYTKYAIYIYPDPKLATLTPVRSMFVFQLFFGILICNAIIQNVSDKILKYTFLTFPFLLGYGYKGVIVIILLSITCIIYRFIKNKIKFNTNFSYYLFILLILALSINTFQSRIDLIDKFTFAKIKHWSTFLPNTKNKNNYKEFFIELRLCPDFLIYDDIHDSTNANFFANKSRYYFHRTNDTYLNYDLFKEHNRRLEIINKIKDNKNVFNNKYDNENFIYISKEPLNFDIYNIKKDFGFMYFFLEKDRFNSLKNECKLLFK
tara:strand:+ start:2067 stop:3773 length:1707 start_codon:yes stop_codon:yes gene_type:complete